jgi:hypothetical protein
LESSIELNAFWFTFSVTASVVATSSSAALHFPLQVRYFIFRSIGNRWFLRCCLNLNRFSWIICYISICFCRLSFFSSNIFQCLRFLFYRKRKIVKEYENTK